jgi:hypothetical protein
MLTPFEVAAKVICPTLRASVAYKLVKEHRFTQQEVAKKLGLKQQAVSNYIRGLRGSMKRISEIEEVARWVERITQSIIEGAEQPDVRVLLVEACEDLLGSQALCEILADEPICSKCTHQISNCPLIVRTEARNG